MAYTYPLPKPPVLDLTPYAKITDIPSAPDLSGYALKTQIQPSSQIADIKWFDTAFATKYTRPIDKASLTSLSLEYKQANGTVRSFSLTDFTTGFAHSGFWNGSGDPNGLTRLVSDTEIVVVSWDGTGQNLTLAAVAKTGGAALQIRKVKLNDAFVDWLPVYDASSLSDQSAANAAKIVTLESETHGLWISKQSIIDWVTDEVEPGRYWLDGKITYQRIFTGTTPNNTNDSLVFAIAGATEIIWWHGVATQASGRKPSMEGLFSGSAAHGTMYTWYTVRTNNIVTGMELRQFNQTGDTRYQNIPYWAIVEYTKD